MTRDSGQPRVYVLILNWNGWADTVECLDSIFRQNFANMRVVVCDNASTDGSMDRIRAWAEGKLPQGVIADHPSRSSFHAPVPKPVRYVALDQGDVEAGAGLAASDPPLVFIHTGANRGFAGGNNAGLRYVLARGDAEYVWLVNNDAVAGPAALAAMVSHAESDSRIGMVGSQLLDYEQPDVVQAFGGGRLHRWQGRSVLVGRDDRTSALDSESVEVDYITGASLLVRTDVIRQVGLMDERYFLYSEEADWCLRAQRAGWRLAFCARSIVWHKEGKATVHRSPLHDYHSVRSSLLFVRKFFPYYLPLTLLYWAYRSVLPKLVRRQPARLGAVLAAYRDFFMGRTSYVGR